MPSVPDTESPCEGGPPNLQSHQQVTETRFSQRHRKRTSNLMNRKFYEKLCCIAIHYIRLVLSTNTNELFQILSPLDIFTCY